MTSSLPQPRRTQRERSAGTQSRILDATLDCLAELGYAATTTITVAARAGVSRGAELHHFPTRAALVAAAVQHLFAALTARFGQAFAALPPQADRVAAAIDLLWGVYQDPRLAAVLELYVAGRTDPELRAQLAPVSERHHANVVRLARSYFPEAAAAHPDFGALLDLALDAVQGMAVRRVVRPEDDCGETLALLKRGVATALTASERKDRDA